MNNRKFLFTLVMCAAAVMGMVGCLWMWPADASNCPGYPFILTNGTTGDATQVMADFNSILGCANTNLAASGINSDITQLLSVTNLAHSGANSDITSLTGLTTPLSIAQGGTAGNTASAARTNLGLGTAAIENLLGGGTGGNVIDSGGNLILSNSGVTGASYTAANITVTAQGIITAASNGTAPPAAATTTQMEAGSATTVFANPGNFVYSGSAIKGWISWNYAGGVLNTFAALNATVSRSGAGVFSVTMTGGFNFAFGTAVCNGTNGGGPPVVNLIAAPQGGLSGTNPSVAVDFVNSGGAATDPAVYASCLMVGGVTN